MSAFDATIRVGQAYVQEIPDENGKTYEAQIVLGVITIAPIGNGQVLPVPVGTMRVPINKDSIKDLIGSLQEAYDKMDQRSNIAVASDISQADKIAASQKMLGGGA